MNLKNKILSINECLNGVILKNVSLHGGDLGLILFDLSRQDNDSFQLRFQELCDNLNNEGGIATFCNGYAGLGWFLQYLISENLLNKLDVEELLLQIDDLVCNSAKEYITNNNHDFLHGSVGLAFYLLDRVEENTKTKESLIEILSHLNNIKKETEKGIYWEEEKEETNTNKLIINFSLSHGVASKIVLLSKLVEKNIETNLSRELLTKSIQFLLNSKNENNRV